ncbi:glycoside hydrolase family 27 protein [Asticcacaulis excentricus]|uniref:Alpha-galactosidase n=1 Tax=Asticcacaulis excentricus (strain ATCC 15261 / DSM 4724 / KCTC 12464 / NCIMB 9791 / VKM B-1370 / CB 48) TaxID=573065 RepID=E8RV34_ASTEC|nr:glycoside hydrolase family 27 protein [Asticcacaulis excentricus]ADU14234.1 Alpha-galactosidase [Asticcacaulis excentricus CB 48]
MRKLFLGLSVVFTLLLPVSQALAKPPEGGWVFDSSPNYPDFTRVIIKETGGKLTGVITSRWYGDLPMQDLRAEGDTLVFKINNGNPRVTPTGIVIKAEGISIRMTGNLWYQSFNLTAHKGSKRELKALDFQVYPLPPYRVVPQKALAPTPPMGWNSWNRFNTEIDDKTVREIADALVSSGLRDAGYVYVNIDDGWQGMRDADGVLMPNAKFPDMKALADYVHSRGLKIGIYSSQGPKTCGGYEGSYGHVEQDARTFANWGMDYLKYDLCSGEAFYYTKEAVYASYQQMGEALAATGRDIVFSLCQYGRFDVGSWGRDVGGHLWRTTGDIEDNYARMAWIGFDANGKPNHTGPNGWNDPDMLEVGNGGMTTDEYKTHMSLWALMAAPLLLGNDVRSMTPETAAILSNRDVIAIDQDIAGVQGLPVKKDATHEIWTKKLSDGATAVGLFNHSDRPITLSGEWAQIGLGGASEVRDLWTHTNTRSDKAYSYTLPAHGVVMLKVR